jgi:hypothetical protein
MAQLCWLTITEDRFRAVIPGTSEASIQMRRSESHEGAIPMLIPLIRFSAKLQSISVFVSALIAPKTPDLAPEKVYPCGGFGYFGSPRASAQDNCSVTATCSKCGLRCWRTRTELPPQDSAGKTTGVPATIVGRFCPGYRWSVLR